MSVRLLPGSRHLTDADVLAVLFPSAGAGRRRSAAAARHLRRCAACAARRAEIERLLDDLAAAHDGAFEAAFPPRRLTALHDRVLRELDRTGGDRRPRARILRFPDNRRRGPRTVWARRPLSRNRGLLGATAAAALLIALGLAYLQRPAPAPGATVPPARAATAAAPGGASDEAFLDAVDEALDGPRVPELSTLDTLTPQVREAAVELW